MARKTLAGVFIAIWRNRIRKEINKHSQRVFGVESAKSLKMEAWDIPDEDDFESRYADELEMLNDFDSEGRYSRQYQLS